MICNGPISGATPAFRSCAVQVGVPIPVGQLAAPRPTLMATQSAVPSVVRFTGAVLVLDATLMLQFPLPLPPPPPPPPPPHR